MELPDLSRIVETHVRVTESDAASYLSQLRRDVSPHIRRLHSTGSIRWYSFLLHTTQQLTPPSEEDGFIIHLRLEPASDLDPADLFEMLPPHFVNPHLVPPLSSISGLEADSLVDCNWAQAWKVFGEASAWVLDLLDAYATGPEPGEIVQFLHFMTNPLLLGHQSVFLPHSQTF